MSSRERKACEQDNNIILNESQGTSSTYNSPKKGPPRKRGRPRTKPRPWQVTNLQFTVSLGNGEPPRKRTAPEVAESYRLVASTWPPKVGRQVATWLRAVADALDANDAALTGENALHAIKDIEDFLHAIAPLVTKGLKHQQARAKAAKSMKGKRWKWGQD